MTQQLQPCTGDWTSQLKSDLTDLVISCSIKWLEGKSKWSFKKLIRQEISEMTFKQLSLKKESYKKLSNLNYTEMKTQSYFTSKSLSFKEKKRIFKYGCRMTNFVEYLRGCKSSPYVHSAVCIMITNHYYACEKRNCEIDQHR